MEHHEQTFLLSEPEIRLLLKWASRDTYNPNQAGVSFSPRAGVAYATDGHRLIAATAPGGSPWLVDGQTPSVTVHRSDLEGMARVAGKAGQIAVRVQPERGTAKIVALSTRVEIDQAVEILGDVAHPAPRRWAERLGVGAPLSRIMPLLERDDHDASPYVAINPRYLADIAGLAAIADRLTPIVWRHSGPLDPCTATLLTDDGVVWRGLIMPMRPEDRHVTCQTLAHDAVHGDARQRDAS